MNLRRQNIHSFVDRARKFFVSFVVVVCHFEMKSFLPCWIIRMVFYSWFVFVIDCCCHCQEVFLCFDEIVNIGLLGTVLTSAALISWSADHPDSKAPLIDIDMTVWWLSCLIDVISTSFQTSRNPPLLGARMSQKNFQAPHTQTWFNRKLCTGRLFKHVCSRKSLNRPPGYARWGFVMGFGVLWCPAWSLTGKNSKGSMKT